MIETDSLAPGVSGQIFPEGDTVYLPFIATNPQGQGLCQIYLAHLESEYRVVKVPTVISAALEHILIKRGYKQKIEWADEPFNCPVELWVKEAAQALAEQLIQAGYETKEGKG